MRVIDPPGDKRAAAFAKAAKRSGIHKGSLIGPYSIVSPRSETA
jgi:hypothetical protein